MRHGGHIPNCWAIWPSFCLYGNFKSIKTNTRSINYTGHLGKCDRGSERSGHFLRTFVEKSLNLVEKCFVFKKKILMLIYFLERDRV